MVGDQCPLNRSPRPRNCLGRRSASATSRAGFLVQSRRSSERFYHDCSEPASLSPAGPASASPQMYRPYIQYLHLVGARLPAATSTPGAFGPRWDQWRVWNDRRAFFRAAQPRLANSRRSLHHSTKLGLEAEGSTRGQRCQSCPLPTLSHGADPIPRPDPRTILNPRVRTSKGDQTDRHLRAVQVTSTDEVPGQPEIMPRPSGFSACCREVGDRGTRHLARERPGFPAALVVCSCGSRPPRGTATRPVQTRSRSASWNPVTTSRT